LAATVWEAAKFSKWRRRRMIRVQLSAVSGVPKEPMPANGFV
jgi:hypothetical protein